MDSLDTASDTALVIAIGRWQEVALAELYRRHGAAVHNLAKRVIASDTLADEVTQEVFFELWRKPEHFDPSRGSLRTLLLTKTHGKAVDLVRAEEALHAREGRSARSSPTSYDLTHYSWDLAVADQVKTALGGLPGNERQAIEMAYFDGLTYQQVAEKLIEPEGTIKSRIRSGLRRLRTVLSEQGVEAP